MPAQAQAPVDIYRAIHKALRLMLSENLVALARLDGDDADERAAVFARFDEALALCASHVAHEDEFIHALVESVRPGAIGRAVDDHVDHRADIAALQAQADTARTLRGDEARDADLRLYRCFSVFVGENFEHMAHEESHHNALLNELFGPAEVMAIEGRIQAAVPPAEMGLILRWMIPALAPRERLEMLRAMRDAMPPPAWDGVLAIARQHLPADGWDKLARGLGLLHGAAWLQAA